jgi:lipoate-protein ligase A
MERWRLVTTYGASPTFNMGLDAALLANPDAPPTLRFYTWRPDTVSLGYFQRVEDVPAAREARALVRRITGGGAIHHEHELTFSIALPASHPLFYGPIADSYVRVHEAIADGLAEYGHAAELRGERQLASDRPGTGMCFHRSTALDLVWGDRKGVGSAQRRSRGRVLHHGSIKLGPSRLEEGIATVGSATHRVSAEELVPRLRAVLERRLGIRLEAGVPERDERELARELGQRAMSPEFVRRR